MKFLDTWTPQSLSSEATTFPAEMYTSEEIYRLEQRLIFGETWYYVGHISQLQGAGSYFTVEIAQQPLVILKNQAGELRGFFNVCSHRAAPVAVGSGKSHCLTCLYHAWSFDLEGNLKGIPAAGYSKANSIGGAIVPVDCLPAARWEPTYFRNSLCGT